MNPVSNTQTVVADWYSEKRIVATVVQSAETTLPILAGELDARDFTDPKCATIFRAASDMLAAGKAVDVTLLVAHLDSTDALGPFLPDGFDSTMTDDAPRDVTMYAVEAIRKLTDQPPLSTAGALSHARQVRKCAQIRRMTEQLTYALEEARRGQLDPSILLGDLGAYIQQEAASVARAPLRLGEATHALLEQYAIAKSPAAVCRTGIDAIDKMFRSGGLIPGLTIIAARPGVGKTSLACTIASEVGFKSKALYIQAEMSGWQTTERLVSTMLKHHARDVWNHQRDIWPQCQEIINHSGVRLIADGKRPTLAQIAGHAYRMHATEGLKLLVIDQLSKIERHGREQQRMPVHEWYGLCGDFLRSLGIELGVTVALLHQINRASREQRRPSMSNLKGCGKLEEDADVIILMDRDNAADQRSRDAVDGGGGYSEILRPDQAWLAVAKNRDGQTGDATVDFDGYTGRVFDPPRAAATAMKPPPSAPDRSEPRYDPRDDLRDDVPF